MRVGGNHSSLRLVAQKAGARSIRVAPLCSDLSPQLSNKQGICNVERRFTHFSSTIFIWLGSSEAERSPVKREVEIP